MSDEIICPICCENLDNYSYIELDCEHKFCNFCIFRYIENKIDDREMNFYCPIENCDSEISHYTVKEIIDDDYKLINKYDSIRKTGEIDEKIHSMCNQCKTVNKKDEDTNEIICNGCRRSYCYICNENHDYTYEYTDCPNEEDINNNIAKIMSTMNDVKLCPICKIIIYREEGCSSMRCKYCKIKFCWTCLRTKASIDKMSSHSCDDYDGYQETNSDHEYLDGNFSD